jgi:hypothetical protein
MSTRRRRLEISAQFASGIILLNKTGTLIIFPLLQMIQPLQKHLLHTGSTSLVFTRSCGSVIFVQQRHCRFHQFFICQEQMPFSLRSVSKRSTRRPCIPWGIERPVVLQNDAVNSIKTEVDTWHSSRVCPEGYPRSWRRSGHNFCRGNPGVTLNGDSRSSNPQGAASI